jgi:hypothetical protein
MKNKIPLNMQLSVPKQRVYIAYLWFKSLTKSDRLYKRGLKHNKNKVSYWGKKLVSSGLVEDCGEYYRIKSYHNVWGALKIKKCTKQHGGKGWRYSILDIDNKNFLKDGLKTYHFFLTRRKKRQIASVLAGKLLKNEKLIQKTETCRMSCKSVSKLLGYKSDMSGHKYRKVYFKIKKPLSCEPVRVVNNITSSGILYSYRIPCFSISLD